MRTLVVLLCDHDPVDLVDRVLLGDDSGPLHRSLPVQSPSIRIHGFLYRLPVRSLIHTAEQFPDNFPASS